MSEGKSPKVSHRGGCHCGKVRFEVKAPSDIVVVDCNCSVCKKSGFLHLIVSREDFELVCGKEHLNEYTFNTGTAKHLFCRLCGIKSFYVPRSHPDGYSVNARCLDEGTVESMTFKPFDGAEWEENIDGLSLES